MKAVLAAMTAMALAGCSTIGAVSPALLSCARQPESPAEVAGATQRDVALYIVDLAAAGDDCRSKLGSVRRILNTPEN